MTEPIRIELPTLYGMQSVNAFLFLEPEPVLIDCGEKTTATWEALQAALAEYNLQIKDLKKIIITHAHVDHMGMAGKIAAESEAEIWVNEYSYDWAISADIMWERRVNIMKKFLLGDLPPNGQGASMKQMLESFTSVVINAWDNIPASRIKTFPMEGVINFGGTAWQIIYAPGHAATQTCFFQKEQGWLIAGDALLRITPTPVFDFKKDHPEIRENSLSVMIKTLENLAKLPIKKVFPGHYQTFPDPQSIIQYQLDRIQMRKEETFGLIKEGKHRFYELFDVLYVNRMNMPGLAMLRGYLDLLLDENKIVEVMVDGYTAYQPILDS